MSGRKRGRLAALVLTAGLLAPGAANAGHFGERCGGPDCPPHCYSPWHYWTPNVFFLRAWFHAPQDYPYGPETYPSVQPTYKIIPYRCPAVDPATYNADRRAGYPPAVPAKP